jgi:hypothetical protein
MWNVDVTTRIRRQPRAAANAATPRASPRVVGGDGTNDSTSNGIDDRCNSSGAAFSARTTTSTAP